MKKIGETPDRFASFNTCQHNGRVFHFSANVGRLVVIEAILGETVTFVTVETCVDCKTACADYIACCSLGKHILVMGGGDDVFAALIDVDEGKLSLGTLHIAALTVGGDKTWPRNPFLCRIAENRALLYFNVQSSMWYCDIAGSTLVMRKSKTVMPTRWGFYTVPIRLPDGKLLAAGAQPHSRDIIFINTDGDPAFEKVGDIPGEARRMTSTILVKERFVVGFGGSYPHLDDLWVFDLQTRQSSQTRKKGEWHPNDSLVPLVVQGDSLHLVGGWNTTSVNSLRLSSLAGLILNGMVRRAYCRVAGLPYTPDLPFTKRNRFLLLFLL